MGNGGNVGQGRTCGKVDGCNKMTVTESVLEFHKAFGITCSTSTRDSKNLDLRLDLVLEEVKELYESAGFFLTADGVPGKEEVDLIQTSDPRPVEMLDALCDLVYVTVGWAVSHGWDFDEAFRRVHASNMTKVPKPGQKVEMREDGKILKPKHFVPPKLDDLV